MDQSMGEAVIASPIRNRRTNNVGVQAFPNVALDGFFAFYLRSMILIVSVEGTLKARRHVRGNRSVNANRAAKNKFLHFPFMRRLEQAPGSFDVDFLEVRRCCVSSATNRR